MLSNGRVLPGLRLTLLSPETWSPARATFKNFRTDGALHQTLLAQVQRLRAGIYRKDGAIRDREGGSQAQQVTEADARSWHVVLLDDCNNVAGCMRLLAHNLPTTFDRLQVRESALARNPQWGTLMRAAVESELLAALTSQFNYVEIGGWALSDEIRGSKAAVACIAATYAWAQLMGGSFGICTATERHGSASILRRTGGSPIRISGMSLPAYYDPAYGCNMELLRFESAAPGVRIAPLVIEMREHLSTAPVIGAVPASLPVPGRPANIAEDRFSHDLQALSSAIARAPYPEESLVADIAE